MTDGKEEAVDGQVVPSFVAFTLPVYKMCSLHSVLSVEAKRVRLEEHLYLLVAEHAVLHNLAGAEEGLAHDEIDLLGQSCQIVRLFAGCVAASHHGHYLLAVEEAVASGTGTHALAHVRLFVGEPEVLGAGTGGNDEAVGLPLAPVIEGDAERLHTEVDTCRHIGEHRRSEAFSLPSHAVHQLACIDAVRKAGEVLHFRGDGELAAGLWTFEQGGGEVSPACIDGSCVARRPAAYNQELCGIHNPMVFNVRS